MGDQETAMTARFFTRRRTLISAGISGVAIAALGVPIRTLAGERVPTPSQSLGPFYPYAPEVERDADLVTVRGGTGIAKGEIAILAGRVLDARGGPVADVRVEIWQCNAFGRYHHPRDRSSVPLDPNFQGYGETVSAADGAYRFRAIRPVPYPGRAPHIHVRLSGRDFSPLATQLYIAGHPQNDGDSLLSSIVDPRARSSLLVPFRRVDGADALSAKFDITLDNNGTLRRV
jgi:protocatechuate 3,4-dioxygenase beta subunit